MPQRDVQVEVIGRRYDCDTCGAEMVSTGTESFRLGNPAALLTHEHACPNDHRVWLPAVYPTYDFIVTQEPLPERR